MRNTLTIALLFFFFACKNGGEQPPCPQKYKLISIEGQPTSINTYLQNLKIASVVFGG